MEKSKKQLILKITLSIIAVILAILCLIIISTKVVSKYDGKFTIEVVNLDKDKVFDKDVKFKEGQTILEIMDNYEIPYQMGEGKEEGMILSISGIKNNNETSDYIMIYVDDVLSPVGLLQIELKDGITLSFKLEHFSFE